MKDGGFRKNEFLLKPPFCKPVLNGLSDLLRLPQYPVLGVRAAAPLGCGARENYTRACRLRASVGGGEHETHTSRGTMNVWARFPGRGRAREPQARTPVRPAGDRPSRPAGPRPRPHVRPTWSERPPPAGTEEPAPQGNLGIKRRSTGISLHPFNWNISMRLGLLTEFSALLSDWQSPH